MSMTLAKNIRKFPKALVTIVRFASTVPSKTIEVEKPINTFYHHDLEIFHATRSQMKLKPLSWDNLKFGQVYTDHMMEVDWNQSNGWSKPLISPLHNFDIHPGAKVLHYAIELFEGMKAFRGVDNKIRMFRPEKNIERMKRTAVRATLPDFDAEELIKLISNTIEIDKEWVPYSDTGFLYIRPTMIGTDPTIGVAVSTQAKLFVLLNPVGASTGFQPISLLADPEYVRAFSGGVGAYKMGCNYAPTLLVGKIAHEMGCHQALWLYDTDEKLTEASAMNIFVYWKNENGEEELVTPPLEDGLILPGVTRDSILVLAREWNEFKISERYPTMEEIRRSLKEKRMLQMFCTGTASGIVPVNRIVYKNKKTKECENLLLPTMESHSNLVKRFYDTILDIQVIICSQLVVTLNVGAFGKKGEDYHIFKKRGICVGCVNRVWSVKPP